MFRPCDLAGAAVILAALSAPQASAQTSPLARGIGAASPLGGGNPEVPSLWYYGPSYSLKYDRAPPGGAGPSYRPSHRFDPFYGHDYRERLERGQRFGPLAPWPHRSNDR